MKYLRYLLFLVLGALVLAFCVKEYVLAHGMPGGFFEVKWIELLNLVCGLLVAVWIADELKRKGDVETRRRELLIEMLRQYERCIGKIYEEYLEYAEKPTEGKARTIISLFKNASNDVSLVKDIMSEMEDSENLISKCESENLFLKFKEAITDTPFGVEKKLVDTGRIDSINLVYRELRRGILRCILGILCVKDT